MLSIKCTEHHTNYRNYIYIVVTLSTAQFVNTVTVISTVEPLVLNENWKFWMWWQHSPVKGPHKQLHVHSTIAEIWLVHQFIKQQNLYKGPRKPVVVTVHVNITKLLKISLHKVPAKCRSLGPVRFNQWHSFLKIEWQIWMSKQQ